MKTKILLLSLLLPLCLKAEYVWLDVTDRYITNPSFDGNSNTGWTYTANAGSKAVNYGCWEFWNGTFDASTELSKRGIRAAAGDFPVLFNGNLFPVVEL